MGESSRRTLEIGDLVEGRYKVLKLLGEGGMGTVFLCEHTLIKRKVAIKVLRPQFASDTTVVERFMNEARAAGTLGHPNIVESTDMGFTHDYVPYIVFEYLEGALLTDEIYRLGGLPHRRAVRIAEQVAAALRAAHDAGIVHRDLKSENVFLTDKDETQDHVKVLDFGISRFMEVDDVHKAMVMGTPEFMAPEQFTTPEAVDGRADIYALGVIMYEMLAARRPFNGATPQELQKRIMSEMPTALGRSDVPNALQELIINRLMAKDRSQRPQSMGEVQALLEQFLTRADGTPIPVPRRRTQPSLQTVDIARNSDTIPRPQGMLNTPYPTMDTIQPPMADLAKAMAANRNGKSKAIYVIAGASLLVGGLGLMYGLKGSKSTDTAAAMHSNAMASVQPQQPVAREPQKVDIDLEANVPGARVTFRRHLTQAPEHEEVAPIDVVELVEFSAPGYKTERYWITFDRPTHLKAHLVKGTGIEEASEEATLVALGEADAIVMTGTAPKLAQNDAAKTNNNNTTPTTTTTTTTNNNQPSAPAVAAATPAPQVAARRKIGRASSDGPEETVKTEAIVQTRTKNTNIATEGAVAMVTAVPAPPKVEAPVVVAEAPKPAPPPAIAAAQPAAQPAPELARTAPPPTAPAVAATAPEAPKTIAPAAFTSMRTSGGAIEPPETVQTQMMRDEKTKASAVVKVCIDANGNVTSATMAKSSGYPDYDKRLTEGVHSWHYKPYMLNGKATPACSAVVFAFKIQ